MFLSFYYIECELFAVFLKILFENCRRFCRPSVIHMPVKCPWGGGVWSPEWTLVCLGHLNGILAWVGGNLKDNFQKSQMRGGLPGGGGGGDGEASIWPIQNGMDYIFILVEM